MKNSTNKRNSNNNRKAAMVVKSPKGKTYPVTNISAFARKHKLDRSSLSRLVNGYFQQHKNWTTI